MMDAESVRDDFGEMKTKGVDKSMNLEDQHDYFFMLRRRVKFFLVSVREETFMRDIF